MRNYIALLVAMLAGAVVILTIQSLWGGMLVAGALAAVWVFGIEPRLARRDASRTVRRTPDERYVRS